MGHEDQKNMHSIRVQYAETSSLYSSQFLVNATTEDITVGCSSGYISDPGGMQGTVLPVHTRIAMTLEGAKRLHDLLGKAIGQAESGGSAAQVPADAKAKLPGM